MADVLLAHSSTVQRALLREVLRLHHDVVDTVTNGIEVVEVSEIADPDVVVMDTQLSIRNGIEAARQLRDRDPDVGLVLCVPDPLDGVDRSTPVVDEIVALPYRRPGLIEAVARAGSSS